MSRLPRGDREGALATMVDMMFGGLGIATVFFLAFVLVRLKSLPQNQPDLKSFIITINSITIEGNATNLSGATLGLIIKRGNKIWYNTETKIEGIRLNPSSIRPRKEPAWNWATPQWVVEVLNRPKKTDQLIVYLATPPFGYSTGQQMTVKIDVSALAVPQAGDLASSPSETVDLQLSAKNGWMQSYSLQSLIEENKIKCEKYILEPEPTEHFTNLHSNLLKKTLRTEFVENSYPPTPATPLTMNSRGYLYFRTKKIAENTKRRIAFGLLSSITKEREYSSLNNSCFHFSVMELDPPRTDQEHVKHRQKYLKQIAEFYFNHKDDFLTEQDEIDKKTDKWFKALDYKPNKECIKWGDAWFYLSLDPKDNAKPRYAICRCEEEPRVLNLTSFAGKTDSKEKIDLNLSPDLYENLRHPNELRAKQKETARLIQRRVRSVGDFSNVEWLGVGTDAVCILSKSAQNKIILHQHLPTSKPETLPLSLARDPINYYWILEKSKIKLFQTKKPTTSMTDKDYLKLWSLILISNSEVHAKLGLRQHPHLLWQ